MESTKASYDICFICCCNWSLNFCGLNMSLFLAINPLATTLFTCYTLIDNTHRDSNKQSYKHAPTTFALHKWAHEVLLRSANYKILNNNTIVRDKYQKCMANLQACKVVKLWWFLNMCTYVKLIDFQAYVLVFNS